jgi:WXG100 family type VII secretion target
MAELIEVSPEMVAKAGSDFVQTGIRLGQLNSRLQSLSNALWSTWKGEAGAQFVAWFQDMLPKLQRLEHDIMDTGASLRDVAATYTTTEIEVTLSYDTLQRQF